jgi:hypothetical protein
MLILILTCVFVSALMDDSLGVGTHQLVLSLLVMRMLLLNPELWDRILRVVLERIGLFRGSED